MLQFPPDRSRTAAFHNGRFCATCVYCGLPYLQAIYGQRSAGAVGLAMCLRQQAETVKENADSTYQIDVAGRVLSVLSVRLARPLCPKSATAIRV